MLLFELVNFEYPVFILERVFVAAIVLAILCLYSPDGFFVYRYSHIALASRTENLVMARGYVSKNLFNRIFCLQI